MCGKIKYLIKVTSNNFGNYDDKRLKTKINSDEDSPLEKALLLSNMVLLVRSVFNDQTKYYSQVFFEKCLFNLPE